MMRNGKDNEITPKADEAALERARGPDTPYEWFEELDRWFDDLREGFFGNRLRGLVPWTDTALRVREPPVEMVDGGREFVVKAELPGVAKEDVDLNVTPDGIEIAAKTDREREEKEKDYYYTERTYSALHRVLPFPAEVLPDQAEASLKDGVLEVRVPKKEPTPERKPVKVRVE